MGLEQWAIPGSTIRLEHYAVFQTILELEYWTMSGSTFGWNRGIMPGSTIMLELEDHG